MTVREFFTRHRVVKVAAVPTVLGVAAVAGLTFALTSQPSKVATQLTASVTECHDMVTISVAGRGDTPVAGTTRMLLGPHGEELPAALSSDYHSNWVDPVVNAPGGAVAQGSYSAVYIAYPANMATYEDAVNAGVANSEKVMTEIRKACPDTRFSVVGYSEGADVARRVAMDVGNQQAEANGTYGIVDPKNVVGVVIFADSGRTAGEGPFPGAANPFGNPDNFDTKYQNGQSTASGQGAMPGNSGSFGALDGKVASFCSDGDLTCAAPQNISLLQLAANVGRQVNADALQKEGLTPATGQDVAVAMGSIAMKAFADIQSQPNWMASDETFLQVLLRVSDPTYKPGTPVAKDPAAPTSISSDEMSPLAYLPQKVFNEIVGLIVTNQNTIPVVMSDPYNLTLGPNGTGHHFDYWRDANAANGKPLTSAQYAAAWLTHLAQQAQAGQPLDTKAQPQAADLDAAYKAAADSKAEKTADAKGTDTKVVADAKSKDATTTTAAPTTTADATTTAPSTTTEAPVTPEVATPPTKDVAATVPETPETTTEAEKTKEAKKDKATESEKADTTTESAAATTTTAAPVAAHAG